MKFEMVVGDWGTHWFILGDNGIIPNSPCIYMPNDAPRAYPYQVVEKGKDTLFFSNLAGAKDYLEKNKK